MKNTTLLTSVIVAFAIGMGFAYALSAYFLAWEYSSEVVEALSAMGVFLTPIVALWIFTRWRQQRHSERLMDQVIVCVSALLEFRYAVGEYAHSLLSNKEKMDDGGLDDDKFQEIKVNEQEKLFDKLLAFKGEVNKVIAIQKMLGNENNINNARDQFSAITVIDFVDCELKKNQIDSEYTVKQGVEASMKLQNAEFSRTISSLSQVYKKG